MKRQSLLLAVGFLVLAGATNTYAYNTTDYQAIKNGRHACEWCDLKGADLHDIRLAGVDLFGADLSGANLAGAIMSRVDMSGAYLSEADLSGATFTDTKFAGTHLDGVDLTKVKAPDADFANAYCDWRTKLPKGWACNGTVIEREYWWPQMPT